MFQLTLTFDNGPDPDVTPEVLDTLAQHDVRATFFVIGKKLLPKGHIAIVRRVRDAGHWVGNHTWSHSTPLGEHASSGTAAAEIKKTQVLLGDLAYPPRLFRPAGKGGGIGRHLLNREALDLLTRDKYTCVLWNSVPRDWLDPDGWVQRALDHCREQAWTLMVLHDLPTGAMRHLSQFLDRVVQSGGTIRQEFPPECVPIEQGRVLRPIENLVSS